MSEPPRRTAPREARSLLALASGRSPLWLLAHGDEEAPPGVEKGYRNLLNRRATGIPTAYLRGDQEFYGRRFRVDPRVLIPRPETEHLVEAVLALTLPANPEILDLGVGSGCLAITLALECPGSRVLGVDSSPAALAVARLNVRLHDVAGRVRLVAGGWARPLDLSSFDLVVSNPPYVDPEDPESFDPSVPRHEPRSALFSGAGGTEATARLFESLEDLSSRAPVVTEIGRGQLPRLRRIAVRRGWEPAAVNDDLAGIPRVVRWRRRSEHPGRRGVLAHG